MAGPALPPDDDNWLLEDDASAGASAPENAQWEVLIVDDEPDVYSATRLVIQDIRYQGRGLSLRYAASAQAAFDTLAAHPDIALILLDVVMETDDAGLRLVHRIRRELNNHNVRIVLRTGQPGQAPEQEIILNYDINDYRTKTELTGPKLYTTVVSSLRAYESLVAHEKTRQGLARLLQAQKEHDARYRVLFELANTPMLLIDPDDGVIIDANLAAQTFYGYSQKQLRNMNIAVINQLSPAELRAEMALAKTGRRDHFDFQHRLACGEMRQVEVRSGALELNGRTLLYSFIYDITARRATELALIHESARLSALLETASDGIYMLDARGDLVLFSHSFASMLGYTDEEANLLNVADWDELVETGLRADVVSAEPVMFETRYRCHDGRTVEVEVHARSVAIGDQIYQSASVRDISARKQNETVTRELGDKILMLNQRFSLAADAAHIGVWEYLIPENRLIWDKWMYALYGVPEETGCDSYLDWQRCLHPDDLARCAEEGFRALRDGGEYDTEFRVVWPTGEVRYLKAAALTSCDRDGTPLRMVGVNYDITHLKRQEEELRHAIEMAESANRAKSRFLATMSHEIRTPMNGILGMAQMLLVPDLSDAERKEYAGTILASGEALLGLLNDILDLSKIETGKLRLESVAFDPGYLIHGVQKLFAEAARSKGLRIESGWDGPIGARYLGDPKCLRQMLSNLVGNAVKFTPQGSIHIDARELEGDACGAVFEFSVADTGIGIADEQLPLLFHRFSQVDSSSTRQYGGTGLGLSIVRSLAQLMGGEAGVDSKAGQGSRFWFRVRVGRAIADQAGSCDSPAALRALRGGAVSIPLSGHILVVEDNPTNLKVIRAMLSKSDLHCDFAEDGLRAVEAIRGGMQPDLVLMDCQMPVMDGFEATRRIREREREMGLPRQIIVALTAGVYEEDRARCLDVGMDDFIEKPINIEKLIATLERWLSGERGAQRPVASPPASGAADDAAEFDESILLARLGGDRELARTVIGSALGDIPAYFDQLERSVVAGNWTDAERKTHTLKSLTAQIGGSKLSGALKEVDDRLKRGGQTDARSVLELRREYARLAAMLQAWR